MRAPYRTSIGVGNQRLAYLDSSADPNAFGAGLGRSLANLGAQLTARDEQTDKFSTLRNFSEFETNVSERLTQMKREADPTGKGFTASAESEYNALEQDFLANEVPPQLREEFTYRAGLVKQRLIGDSLDFQYKAGDAYFKQGVADELSKAQLAIAQDPSQLDSWKGRLSESINATDLAEFDKRLLRREALIGLEGVAYQAAVKSEILSTVTPEGRHESYRRAISSIETGSPEGDYSAIGKPVKGDRAYGRYQVMGNNIGPWTKEVLGREYSIDEFLADKDAQDTVFDVKFGQSVRKYGNPQDAAAVWNTGDPLAEGGSDYVNQFNKNLGLAHATSGTDSKELLKKRTYLAASSVDRLDDTFADRLGQLFEQFPELKLLSGYRTFAKQKEIYDSGIRPAAKPGHSRHERGAAADLNIDQLSPARRQEVEAAARALGLENPIKNDSGHFQLAGDSRRMSGVGGVTAMVDNDPRFANIPFEDRLSLRKSAEADANSELNAMMAQQKASNAQFTNDLLQGIEDGRYNQTNIDQAYDSGRLDDYDTRMKVQNAYDAKIKEGNVLQSALVKAGDPNAVWDPFGEDDKKMQNALMSAKINGGPTVLDQVKSMDPGVIENGIYPLVARTHDIPTDLAGTLTGMYRSNNQSQFLFAMDTLNGLRSADRRAFDQRIDERTAKDVDLYARAKDLYPADQLMGIVNGGTSPEERQRTTMLREEGQDLLNSKKNGVTHLSEIVADFIGDQEWGTTARQTYAPAARALDAEYQTLFVEAYGRMGNEEAANAYARTALSKTWSVTEVGDNKPLMKYPPEKVGYQTIEGSYDWMSTNARIDLRLQPGEKFELISDATTEQEVKKWQAGTTTERGPSYQAIITDVNGVSRLSPGRIYFKPDENQIARDTASQYRKQAEYDLHEVIDKYTEAKRLNMTSGVPIPKELEELYQDAFKRLHAPVEYPPSGVPSTP